jgi:hypothetical protein
VFEEVDRQMAEDMSRIVPRLRAVGGDSDPTDEHT